MNKRYAAVAAAACIGVLIIGGGAWLTWRWTLPAAIPQGTGETELAPLPIPPVPPRIAEGADYEHCLDLLGTDAAGANAFADAWEATGGGDGAVHCHALAQVALGDPETGADMLQKLANVSHAPDLARAAVYGQAGQAWLMAGDAARAYASATLALSLSADDPELLIDRSIAAATLERYQDAIDDLDRALEMDPKRADALVFRGAAYRHLGNLENAQNDIDHALLIDPDNADALLERGILRQRDGDPAGARTDWERAMALAPDTATSDLAQQNLALLDAGPERR
jgi:tetratricopeptide (TPR) repeat protein